MRDVKSAMNEESIFAAALEKKSSAERKAFLDETCGGNAELRAAVEELLSASAAAGSFLEHPPAGLDVTVDADESDTHKPAGWDGTLAFLQPADKPGRIGKLVGNAGVYEIIEVVGSGGMGIVLRAFDTKLSRVVAVKVLAPELARNPTAVNRFLREAKAAAAVVHDHVVTIHNVEETHQPPFLVMQFVDGQTLQQKIDRAGALELKEILRIGCQAAAGLAAAHKHGLVHRDIKPSNILLENGVERVKITDFGLARAADDVEITQTGLIAGTPQYMSPEQARGEPLDPRSDLFSLGSVLYTMCTGRPAFRAETTMGVIRRVCDDEPRPIREVNAEIPPWLESIVQKLLSKNPAHRFQTAAEVAELLSQHLAHEQNPSSMARPATVFPTPAPKLASDPGPSSSSLPMALLVVIAAVVGLPLLLVLLAVGAWFFYPIAGVPGRVAQSPRQPALSHDDHRTGPAIEVAQPANRDPGAPQIAAAPFDAAQARSHQEIWAGHLQVPVDYVNQIGLKMKLIPPGEFQMGSTQAEADRLARALEQGGAGDFETFVARMSSPQHLVRLTKPYRLSECEVTIGQYRKFIEATKYVPTMEQLGINRFRWTDAAVEPSAEERAVIGVSWDDAKAFCQWLSEQEGRTYDLPTEAQWEFACRAGTTTAWSFGDDAAQLDEHAVFGRSSFWPAEIVASKAPNPFGLFDMHGNADEWCLDWHFRDFYASSPTDDPVCSTEPQDKNSGRVTRGGTSHSAPWWTRSTTRAFDFPTTPNNPKGFRVAMIGDLSDPLASE